MYHGLAEQYDESCLGIVIGRNGAAGFDPPLRVYLARF
jgi:hypothetical protein